MAHVQNIDVFAGETRTLVLSGRDEFNLPVDLTDKTIVWHIGRSPFRPDNITPIVTKTGAVDDAAMGMFTVPLESPDTDRLNGDFEHQAIASDTVSRAVICHGRLRIRAVLS